MSPHTVDPHDPRTDADPEDSPHEGHDGHSHTAHTHALGSVGEVALQRAAGVFRAAGDPARLRVLELLSHGELCVTDVAAVSGEELSTVSQRLRVLRAERLVRRRRDGKHIYYALADAHIASLLHAVLEHVCEHDDSED
ncbi:MAG: metalloregulator ArsR/SmtB family transcription factor [Deltaproteobacteria bacterium]|nr:metalloregulator ArsR/SmtB family transcription factor [Deltaproteobacteria bacterium]